MADMSEFSASLALSGGPGQVLPTHHHTRASTRPSVGRALVCPRAMQTCARLPACPSECHQRPLGITVNWRTSVLHSPAHPCYTDLDCALTMEYVRPPSPSSLVFAGQKNISFTRNLRQASERNRRFNFYPLWRQPARDRTTDGDRTVSMRTKWTALDI